MNTNYGTYDYLLSPNNNIVVHYELYEQPESEDRITPERKEIIINKLILHGDEVQDELEGLLENIQSDMELNYEKL
jgi:hypothetical protein|tara:strand:- start:456 stop:683 length:228 start_codon:yes stop_codon:yes gene_type:complete